MSYLACFEGKTDCPRYRAVKCCDPDLNRKEIRSKAVTDNIFGRFCCDYCLTKVASDVISGVAVYQVDMDVGVKCGDSILNGEQIIQLFVGRVRFTPICAVFSCILQPTGSSS